MTSQGRETGRGTKVVGERFYCRRLTGSCSEQCDDCAKAMMNTVPSLTPAQIRYAAFTRAAEIATTYATLHDSRDCKLTAFEASDRIAMAILTERDRSTQP